MQFNKLIPELSVRDINVSKKFYLDLSFKIMYEREENKFCFVEMDGNQIMLEEVNSNWEVAPLEYPFGRGINISMSIDNIEEVYARIVEDDIKLFKTLETHSYRVNDKVYDDKEFLIQDPDGYLLRFNN